MSGKIKSLSDRQLFWQTLFETKQLAAQLASLATNHVDGVTYDDLPQYGKVHVVAQSGSNLGDNFQSDTFIVTARLLRGQSEEPIHVLSTFIKVIALAIRPFQCLFQQLYRVYILSFQLLRFCTLIGAAIEFLASQIGLRISRPSP